MYSHIEAVAATAMKVRESPMPMAVGTQPTATGTFASPAPTVPLHDNDTVDEMDELGISFC